ncbi:hypothetical protein TWF751_002264 [Orbilia oligospora]|nr:hypothetical protein TWF751_002264 [Orbilia oligospora]
MDLPPAVSASSSSAAHFLQLSTSTAVGHNSSSSSSTSSLAGLGGQTGPRTQPAVRSSTSALGSAPPSLQAPITSSEKCAHKDVTRCSLHRGECCSCGDNRPHEQYYERYVDGSLVLDAPRWAHYCSACRDYWDRLNASVPSYRDNQPRLTAWDLFHDFGYSNPPPNPAAVASAPHPNFAHSNSTSRHSLTSPAVPVITPEDGFPQSYAVFQHMSPNFSNEYHPVVAQHIRTWGELETRIADEPRYSPGFQSLLRQYYTARYKAKRMTELDRQSRGGSLSVQARDEYFQLLNTPGPFDMPISSGSGSGSSGNGRNESSSSGGGNSSASGGVGGSSIGGSSGGIGGGGGGSSTRHSLHLHQPHQPHQPHLSQQPHQLHQSHQSHQPQYQHQHQHSHPNLGQIGISFGRAATFSSFLQSASTAQTASNTAPHTTGASRNQGNNMSHQPPSSTSTSTAAGEHRSTLSTGTFTGVAARSTSATSQVSPPRSSHRRRGNTPVDSMPTARINSQPENASRPAPVIDRERERDRDRETGRITAGTSPYAAAAAAATASNQVDRHQTLGPPTPRHSSTAPAIGTSSAAAASSSPSSSASPHSIPPSPFFPPQTYHAPPNEIPEISDYHHSHSYNSASNPTSFVRSRRIRPNRDRRRRRISPVTPDIETERSAADRRRQLRERNESEWENQRPLSISSPGGSNTNRTGVDSTVVDAVMSDLPSSQNSDTSNRSSNSASEPGRASENEPSVHNPLRHRPYFNIPPTSEPWNTSLLPGESSRNQLNDPSVTTPYRRDGSSNPSASTPQNTMSGSPITSIAPFVFPANRRTLRPTLLDQTTSSPTQSPPESSMARNGLTSPANRLPPNFLPSLPHLPAPRFSPPRTLTRPRGGSISNNSNNNTNTDHNRQNSNGSDGFPARRRERINPSAQPLGGRTDAEREDYESPTRSVFTELVETNRQAEITRRRFRELEAEQRELLRSPPMPGSDGDSMRRLQEHRQQRNYELLQRANLQRQMQQNQVDLPGGSRPQPVGPQGWYANWPGASQSASNGNNAHARSPDHASALSFTVVAEDEPSSASEADYEDLIPLDNALNDDEQLFATLVGGYLSGVPHESVNRRRARLRGQLGLSPDDVGHLPGSQPSNRAPENDMRERFPSRADRARRMRDRDIETRYRHNEAIRDIANLVTGARESGVMGFPHRWSRESGSGSNSNGRNTNNNNSQTTRTLDNPERPDNMKEEDLKIMVDCKVCYGQIADMVLLPCAHLVLCQWCADTVAPAAPNRPEGMVAPRSNCPVCRARVERKIKVFRC